MLVGGPRLPQDFRKKFVCFQWLTERLPHLPQAFRNDFRKTSAILLWFFNGLQIDFRKLRKPSASLPQAFRNDFRKPSASPNPL
jgi:hypothetical protein